MKLFSSKLFIGALALLVVCAGLISFSLATGKLSAATVGAGFILAPMEKAITAVGDYMADVAGYFYKYDSLVAENEELLSRVQELEKKEREYYAAIDENTYLRELAGLKRKNSDFDYELAEVIGVSSDGVSTVYTLARGSSAGIEVNDAIITAEGLAGYVTMVGVNFCEARALTDVSLKMGAAISRTREVTVAEGNFDLALEGKLKLSYIKNDSDILVGDTVETTGYGGIFPKGLLIGTVTEVLPETHGISTYAKIEPAADLQKLKKVYIIKSFTISE